MSESWVKLAIKRAFRAKKLGDDRLEKDSNKQGMVGKRARLTKILLKFLNK
jgi:hypothetical protein